MIGAKLGLMQHSLDVLCPKCQRARAPNGFCGKQRGHDHAQILGLTKTYDSNP